jgi:hypothetical protein
VNSPAVDNIANANFEGLFDGKNVFILGRRSQRQTKYGGQRWLKERIRTSREDSIREEFFATNYTDYTNYFSDTVLN